MSELSNSAETPETPAALEAVAAPDAAPAPPPAETPAALSEPAATVEEFVTAAVEAAAPADAAAVAESAAAVESLPTAAESAPAAAPIPAAPDAEAVAVSAPVADLPVAANDAAPAQAEQPQAEQPQAEQPQRRERGERRGPRPDAAESDRVVRTLAVGQELEGTVRRVSEFGAFVDIGVGRDGLVHISELSVKRVAAVTDVIKEGEKHTFWIKKLDRERNRISLTLIAPGTTTMRDLNKDDLVTGTVTRILPYGAFVDIGVGRDALLHVREMGNRFIAKPEDVVKVGEQIEARIIEIQKRRGRIDLSIKGLREEPEPEPAPEPEPSARGGKGRSAAEPEPEVPDSMADVHVMTPMELAFLKARQQSGVDEPTAGAGKKGSEDHRAKARQAQEEAFQRTLKQK